MQNWRNRKDTGGHFFNNVPDDWARRDTIREVPEEEQRKSSVQFDPNAPVTHIYPPRRTLSPEKLDEEDHVQEVEIPRRGSHAPLSPVPIPEFISAPPTPRYVVPKRTGVQKQFSFGKGGRKQLTEEETMGLVEAGRNEGGMSDRETVSQHSEHSETEDSDYERDRRTRQYEMF